MATDEEKRAFGIHKKYGVLPMEKNQRGRSNMGSLYYNNELIYSNTFALCQVERKRLISQGYKPASFKLKYAVQ